MTKDGTNQALWTSGQTVSWTTNQAGYFWLNFIIDATGTIPTSQTPMCSVYARTYMRSDRATMIAKNGMYVNTSANKIMWMGDDGFIVQQGNQALKLDSVNGMQWGRQTGSGSSVQLQWFNFWNYRPFTTTSSMTRQYMLVPTINEYRYCFVINAFTQHGDLWVDLPAYDDGGSPKQTWIILPPTSTIPQGWQVRIIYMMS